jgi:hypothetical protein
MNRSLPSSRPRAICHAIVRPAVARHRQLKPLGLLAQRLEIETPIIIGKEDILPIVPALRDMRGDAGHDDTGGSRHVAKRSRRRSTVNTWGLSTVPTYPGTMYSDGFAEMPLRNACIHASAPESIDGMDDSGIVDITLWWLELATPGPYPGSAQRKSNRPIWR